MTAYRKHFLAFALLAFVVAFLLTRGLIAQPGFTDAFYHFNAANRLVSGEGLTDPYLWTYIAAPDQLPAPSHLYWMPMTSLTAAVGMALVNQPGSYAAAQWPFTLMFAAVALLGFHLGGRLGGALRHAWLVGLLTLFSGYFTRFWGATDTFAPYAFFGAFCLYALGWSVEQAGRRALLGFVAAGALAGLAHLTRNDGLLLLFVGWLVILWPFGRKARPGLAAVFTLTYLVVMLPWFARNLAVVGTILPVGGIQGAWFTEYNDLFSYPADASAQTFFAGGIGRLLATRWEAFTNNLATFVAVEGWIVLTPFMLVGLWRRRTQPFLRGFWLYALGLHLAMTLVFAFPGYRGGLFHSAAALVPFWAALGIVGLDDAVSWAAKRRRWRAGTAKWVFSLAALAVAVYLSLMVGLGGRVAEHTPTLYRALSLALPPDARVMVNDPAQLYYFTGLGGVVLPNEAPDVIPEIARRYGVGYLLLEGQGATPAPLLSIYENPPDFFTPLPFDVPNMRLYAIELDTN